MAGAIALLILPLVGVLYIQMKKGLAGGGASGADSLSVFEQRAGRQKKTIAPSLAPALPVTNNLTEQVPKDATLERREDDSLNFLRGGQDYSAFQPMKGGAAELQKLAEGSDKLKDIEVAKPVEKPAETAVAEEAAKPAAPIKKAAANTANKPFRGPKLKAMKSNFGAKGSFRDSMPGAGEKKAEDGAPPGMPPGMDMGAMMKMAGQGGGAGGAPPGMPPGMDMGAMMKMAGQGSGAGAGGAAPAMPDMNSLMKNAQDQSSAAQQKATQQSGQ